MRLTLLLPTGACVLLLAACGGRSDTNADAASTVEPPAAPAPAPVATPASPTPLPATPPPTANVVSPTYAGFGPATYGSDAEAVRQSWGRDMDGTPPAAAPGEAEGCYLLTPKDARTAQGRPALHFMIEGGTFVRTDVRGTDYVAPGGGRVGMTAAQIESLYAGGIERQPHEYVEGGQYLRVRDAASGHVLVFETDAGGTVTTWRVGQVPQVDYVESCS